MDLGVYTLLLDKPKWIPWHLKNPFEAWGALFRRLRHKKRDGLPSKVGSGYHENRMVDTEQCPIDPCCLLSCLMLFGYLLTGLRDFPATRM